MKSTQHKKTGINISNDEAKMLLNCHIQDNPIERARNAALNPSAFKPTPPFQTAARQLWESRGHSVADDAFFSVEWSESWPSVMLIMSTAP